MSEAAGRAARIHRPTWHRATPPEAVLVVAGLTALAWIGLALGLGSMPSMAGAARAPLASPPPWFCHPASGSMAMMDGAGPVSEALAGMPMWSLMAVAMMAPSALPATSHVVVNSMRRRRRLAAIEFVLAYLVLWLAIGVPTLLLVALLPVGRAAVILAAVLGLAAIWGLSPAKRRALVRCHRTSPLPPAGWRASLGSLRFGLLHGRACVASCWPLMLVMALAPTARLAWCAGLGTIAIAEKLARRPRRGARRASAVLGFATVVAAGALVTGGA